MVPSDQKEKNLFQRVIFIILKDCVMNNELMSEKIKCLYLKKHPLFNDLSEEQLKQISTIVRLVKLNIHNTLRCNNDMVSNVYFLGNGKAKLVGFDNAGHNSVKDILVDGEIFGDTSLSGFFAKEHIIALIPNTFIYYFPVPEFKNLLQENHKFALNYAEMISTKLKRLEEKHSVWTTRDAKERLQYFFQGWAACGGKRVNNKVILENYFSLGDIADFICVSRQFMHVMLKELKKEGLLYYSRQQIEVADAFFEKGIQEQKQII